MPDAGAAQDRGALGLPGCVGCAARGTAVWPASPLIAPAVAGPIAGAAAALHDRPSYGTLRHRCAAAVLLVCCLADVLGWLAAGGRVGS